MLILFFLENCSYCRQLFKLINEVKTNEKYKNIASFYDYYYVPCFFKDNKKIHERIIKDKYKLMEIFNKYLNE